jgi:hypothetical protein
LVLSSHSRRLGEDCDEGEVREFQACKDIIH